MNRDDNAAAPNEPPAGPPTEPPTGPPVPPAELLAASPHGLPAVPLYKRPLDLLILVSSHTLLFPLFFIFWFGIPALILLTDGRPILYRTMKVGRGGREIPVLKFRTMVRDADKIGPSFTSPDDPRITPIGRVLRKTGLDELPQLIAIARGDMSFVGPRPYNLRSFGMYQAKQRQFYRRLRALPGLTGLAAVYGDPSDPQNRLANDLLYIRRMSLFLDVRLLFTSAWIGLTGGWERKMAPDKLKGRN